MPDTISDQPLRPDARLGARLLLWGKITEFVRRRCDGDFGRCTTCCALPEEQFDQGTWPEQGGGGRVSFCVFFEQQLLPLIISQLKEWANWPCFRARLFPDISGEIEIAGDRVPMVRYFASNMLKTLMFEKAFPISSKGRDGQIKYPAFDNVARSQPRSENEIKAFLISGKASALRQILQRDGYERMAERPLQEGALANLAFGNGAGVAQRAGGRLSATPAPQVMWRPENAYDPQYLALGSLEAENSFKSSSAEMKVVVTLYGKGWGCVSAACRVLDKLGIRCKRETVDQMVHEIGDRMTETLLDLKPLQRQAWCKGFLDRWQHLLERNDPSVWEAIKAETETSHGRS